MSIICGGCKMVTFDGVYVPERGDIILKRTGNIKIYILVLGTDCAGLTYGYPIIFLDIDNKDKEYIKLMFKTSLTYIMSNSIDTSNVMLITGALPTSIIYNKYSGIKDKCITAIPKKEVDLWLVKSKMNGVSCVDDYSFSLSNMLQEYRNRERKKVDLTLSLDMVKLTTRYYALVIGTYEGKNMYINFRNTEKFLSDPDTAVVSRMATNRIKILSSAKGFGKPCIKLKEETKDIVRQRLKKELQWNV